MNNRFKLLRKTLNISQEDFGKAIGLTKSGISSLESGTRSLNDKHIRMLQLSYNVNPEWLRNGTGDMFLKADAEITNTLIREHNLSPAATDFIKNFLALPHNKQEILIEVLSEIVK